MKRFFLLLISAFLLPAISTNADEVNNKRTDASLALGQKMCIYQLVNNPAEYKKRFSKGIDFEDEKKSLFKKVPWLKTEDGVLVTQLSFEFYSNFLTCDGDEKYNTSSKTRDELTKELYENAFPLINKRENEKKIEKNTRNKVDEKIRKKCLKAKDYAGCMEYESSK